MTIGGGGGCVRRGVYDVVVVGRGVVVVVVVVVRTRRVVVTAIVEVVVVARGVVVVSRRPISARRRIWNSFCASTGIKIKVRLARDLFSFRRGYSPTHGFSQSRRCHPRQSYSCDRSVPWHAHDVRSGVPRMPMSAFLHTIILPAHFLVTLSTAQDCS